MLEILEILGMLEIPAILLLEIPESRGKVRQGPSLPGRPCSLIRWKI